MGKIYCSECGAQIEDNVQFCSRCGSKVNYSKIDNHSKSNLNFNLVGFFILSLVVSIIIWALFEVHYDYSRICAVVLVGSFIEGFLNYEYSIFSIVKGMVFGAIFVGILIFIVTPITFPFDLLIFGIVLGGIASPLGSFLRSKVSKK